MNIELTRIEQHGEAISGFLRCDGKRVCETAENAQSCLAKGVYRIVRHPCSFYKRIALLAVAGPKVDMARKCKGCTPPEEVNLNSPCPCFCPQLKPGNGVHNRRDGSIRVGEEIAPGYLQHPLEKYNLLHDRIRKCLSRGGTVTLTIE